MSLKISKLASAAAAAGALALAATTFSAPASAQSPVMVGGAPMYADKTIAQNAPEAPNLTTLVAAASAAGLVETLGSPGPFTVFAPTNSAFEELPAGTVDTLLKPENKGMLTNILTYHVVPGTLTASDLMAMAEKSGGVANLTTVSGDTLSVRVNDGKLVLIDESDGGAVVQTPDVMQANGVVHVIGDVLMPQG